MNQWTALVPLKSPGMRKTRLSRILSIEDRDRLSDAMARHVLSTALACRAVSSVVLLSATPPPISQVAWLPDLGGSLNDELRRAVEQIAQPTLVLPADLPALSSGDIDSILEAGNAGVAIAPDKHELGTNGLALLQPAGFVFLFGEHSFKAHLNSGPPTPRTVVRWGFQFDIDNEADYKLAVEQRFVS